MAEGSLLFHLHTEVAVVEVGFRLLACPQDRCEDDLRHGKSEPVNKNERELCTGFARKTKETGLICCEPGKSALFQEGPLTTLAGLLICIILPFKVCVMVAAFEKSVLSLMLCSLCGEFYRTVRKRSSCFLIF